jgi:hypothetical protein
MAIGARRANDSREGPSIDPLRSEGALRLMLVHRGLPTHARAPMAFRAPMTRTAACRSSPSGLARARVLPEVSRSRSGGSA